MQGGRVSNFTLSRRIPFAIFLNSGRPLCSAWVSQVDCSFLLLIISYPFGWTKTTCKSAYDLPGALFLRGENKKISISHPQHLKKCGAGQEDWESSKQKNLAICPVLMVLLSLMGVCSTQKANRRGVARMHANACADLALLKRNVFVREREEQGEEKTSVNSP